MPRESTPISNRYSALASGEEELQLWWDTFVSFDRDGGGDVDLKELGLMFRQLGHTPTEKEMQAMIDAVDFDGSGTIDFEEFCLLMLRQQRALITPEWLLDLFVEEPDDPSPPPEVVNLKGSGERRPAGPGGWRAGCRVPEKFHSVELTVDLGKMN